MPKKWILEGQSRVHGRKRVRIETPEQHLRRLERSRDYAARRKAEQAGQGFLPPIAADLKQLAQQNDEASCLEYFRSYKGSNLRDLRPDDFLYAPPPYLGREHIEVANLGKNWLKPMWSLKRGGAS